MYSLGASVGAAVGAAVGATVGAAVGAVVDGRGGRVLSIPPLGPEQAKLIEKNKDTTRDRKIADFIVLCSCQVY